MTARRRWIGLGVLLAAGLGFAGWWFADRFGPTVEPPPVPTGLDDPRVIEALAAARAEVVRSPRSGAAWGKYGLVLQAHAQLAESDFCFAEAARRDPSDPRWPYLIGTLLMIDRPDEGFALMRQALAAPGGTPEVRAVVRLRLAEALLEVGQAAEAERLFREVLEMRPGDARATLGLGVARLAQDDPAGADRLFRAASRDPGYVKRALGQLALIARLRNDPAAADLEREVAALPDDPPTPDPVAAEVRAMAAGRKGAQNRAADLAAEGRTTEAIRILADEAKAHPDLTVLRQLSTQQARAGRYADAVASLRSAAELAPEDSEIRHTLGLYLAVLADQSGPRRPEVLKDALAQFDRALTARPDNADTHMFRGQVLWALGDRPAALAAIARGLELAPHKPDQHLALLTFLEKDGKLDEARRRLPAAEKVIPASNQRFQELRERLRAGGT